MHDDHACLAALEAMWSRVWRELPASARIVRIGVTLPDLSPAGERQLDILLNDDRERRRWEAITAAMDQPQHPLRAHGALDRPLDAPGGNAGGKISYTRI